LTKRGNWHGGELNAVFILCICNTKYLFPFQRGGGPLG
jgi:hypothetical protein